jgi:2-haloalkanoic acid dehalogenase type II
VAKKEVTMQKAPPLAYDAVLFDLLTGLLDSWTLWNSIAGSEQSGRKWRAAYLSKTYGTGAYRSYELLVEEAALEVGLPVICARELAERYGELRPWPEVGEVLTVLQSRVPLGIVTNCSEALAAKAVAAVKVPFRVVVTAERAGFYKPHARPYQIALEELSIPASRCLFVAGSAYDLFGTSQLGLATYWHNRIGMSPPAGMPVPAAHHKTLQPLVSLLLDGKV